MAEQQFFTVDVDENYTLDQREQIAEDIIVTIIDRTQRGFDKNGKKFPAYTDGYINSPNFQFAEKSATPVNLTLSGEMLNAMEFLPDKSPAGKIAIGYDAGDAALNGKVEGNRLGTYGHGHEKREQFARDFLGVTEKELTKILKRYEFALPTAPEQKLMEDLGQIDVAALGQFLEAQPVAPVVSQSVQKFLFETTVDSIVDDILIYKPGTKSYGKIKK